MKRLGANVLISNLMNWQSRITIDPNILVGKPTIEGTRLAVEFIIDLLAQGWTTQEVLRNYPGIATLRYPSLSELWEHIASV